MKNHLKFWAILLYGTLIGTSCVSDEYDLNKEIDKNITILRNFSLPIGDLGTLTLDEILKTDYSMNLLKVDENNDYFFSLTGNKISYGIEDLEFVIPKEDMTVLPMNFTFPTSEYEYSRSLLPGNKLVYSELTGGPFQSTFHLRFDSDLPSEITEIRNIDVDSEFSIIFTVNEGKVYAERGLSLTFPEYMQFTKVGDTSDYVLSSSGHTVVLSKDVAFSADEPFIINLNLDSIIVPPGSIAGDRFVLDNELSLNGDFYLMTQDFSSIPAYLKVELTPEISDIEIESVEAKFDIEHNLDDNYIAISKEVPEFFLGEGFILDFYNPTLFLDITNSIPLAFELSAELVSLSSDDQICTVNPFGSDGATLSVQANSDHTSFLISRRAAVTNTNVTNIVVPQLGDLIRRIPENIGFHNIKVVSDTDDYVNITSDQTLNTEVNFDINVPLAFDKDLKLEFVYDLEDLGLVLDTNIDHTVLTLDFVNSIPLTFSLSVFALGEDGNIAENIVLSTEKKIAAGTHLSPTSSTVSIDISNYTGKFEIDTLRLSFTAEASSEYLGIALNKAQGIKIENVSFAMPDGVEIDLSKFDDKM